MVEEVSSNIGNIVVVVKVSAKSYYNSNYVSVLLFLDKEKSELIDIVYGISDNIYFANETEASKSWISIEKAIRLTKNLAVDIPSSTALLLKDSMSSIFNKEIIDSILLCETNNSKSVALRLFESTIRNVLKNPNVALALYFQRVTLNNMINEKSMITSYLEENPSLTNIIDYESDKVIKESIEKTALKFGDNPNDYRMIKSDFVFAPISGKPINMIDVGDSVIIKTTPTSIEEQESIIEAGGEKDKRDLTYKVPATIIEKFLNSNLETIILVKLKGAVYSKIVESEPIRVLTIDTNSPKLRKEKPLEIPAWIINSILFVSLWVLFFLIIIIYIFF